MHVLTDCLDTTPQPVLIVLLPPAMTTIDDLIDRGFVAALRARGVAADITLAGITHEHLIQKRANDVLRDTVIAPARASGYRQIWLAGISLGAFNALHYAAHCADEITGLCLLAPYPGTGDTLREINAAGGVARWAALPNRTLADERMWWYWLWQQSCAGAAAMPIFAGLSEDDRFLSGQRMLTGLLPQAHVDVIAGTHDWPAWLALWQRWLQRTWLKKSWANTRSGTA